MIETKKGIQTRKMARLVLWQVVVKGKNLQTIWQEKNFSVFNEKDKALIKAIVLSALRHRGEINYWLEKFMKTKMPKNELLNYTLHIATAQLLFLNIPAHAAIDLAVHEINFSKTSKRYAKLANAILRKIINEKEKILSQNILWRSKINCPAWLWQQLRKDYGKEKAQAIVQAHMQTPQLHIHVLDNIDAWQKKLEQKKIKSKKLFGNCLAIKPCDVKTLPQFNEGKWWVQNAAASLPVLLLGDIKNKKIADLCAAPGGKTIQLVKGGACVIAVDENKQRIEILKQNMQRMKMNITILQKNILQWQTKEMFDAILLDAPCSATGTVQKNPDILYNKSKTDIENMAQYQKQLINSIIEKLKIGGLLVFANCSLARQEGENIIAQIVKEKKLKIIPIQQSEIFNQKQFINKQGTLRTLPTATQITIDGFFAARMCRIK